MKAVALAAAIVAAAGRGERMAAGTPKCLLSLGGRPLVAHALMALEDCPAVGDVVVVAPPGLEAAVVEQAVRPFGLGKVRAVVPGGAERRDSVGRGLDALLSVIAAADAVEVVVVHDGARPLARPELFARVVEAARRAGAAVAALPVADTIKRVDARGAVATVPRAGLWAAQTPQAFHLDLLRRAHGAATGAAAGAAPARATDDAALVEALGARVELVAGDPANIKVTTPADLELARTLYAGRAGVAGGERRVGLGYDVHRLAEGRPLYLGGVKFPGQRGLVGHSDGDALLHAVADAVLGAAGCGDIGVHFPSRDERWRDASSVGILAAAARIAAAMGWAGYQVDATLVAEEPRVGPRAAEMAANIAAALGIPVSAVNVKATTNEGLGDIGAGLGIAAYAVVAARPAASGGAGRAGGAGGDESRGGCTTDESGSPGVYS